MGNDGDHQVRSLKTLFNADLLLHFCHFLFNSNNAVKSYTTVVYSLRT